jgi:hypothetical protein
MVASSGRKGRCTDLLSLTLNWKYVRRCRDPRPCPHHLISKHAVADQWTKLWFSCRIHTSVQSHPTLHMPACTHDPAMQFLANIMVNCRTSRARCSGFPSFGTTGLLNAFFERNRRSALATVTWGRSQPQLSKLVSRPNSSVVKVTSRCCTFSQERTDEEMCVCRRQAKMPVRLPRDAC